MNLIHIGRSVPRGFEEVGGVHLGKGLWMFRIRPVDRSTFNKVLKADETLRKIRRASER